MRIWIDTDTASDDAVALVIALKHPDVDVVGISVVAGNVPLDQGIQNALFTRELCGADHVPIYAGQAAPLQIELETAQNVHGGDGMGDIGLDLVGREPDDINAVDQLLAAADGRPLTLVTLGPLTNIARAVERDPSIVDRIERVVAMGAVADHIGNVTPVAEFNMWADPDAVATVLNAGFALEFVGWDISRKYAVIDAALSADLRSIATPLAEFVIDIQRVVVDYCATETGLAGFDLPDPIAMAYAIDPTVATEIRDYHLAVETRRGLTRGMVVMDVLGLQHQPPNARVVTAADGERFVTMLRAAISHH